MEIKGTIDIQRPVEAAFDYMNEPKNNLEWETGVLEMEYTTEGPVGVGSKGRRVENYMGRDEGTWEITEYEENKRVAIVFESQKAYGNGSWELEANDGGTRLSYRFNGTPRNPLWKLIMPIMMPMMRRSFNRNYGNLKRILESQG